MEEDGIRSRFSKTHLLIFLGMILTVYILLNLPITTRQTSYTLEIGDVAPQDITAPRTITYVSDLLTRQAKEDAAEAVADVYLPADPTISRNQAQNLRYLFQYITSIRGDTYSDQKQKIEDFNKNQFVRFDEETIVAVLSLSADDWSSLQEESLRIVEEIMQNSIREDQVRSQIENIPAMVNYFISVQISSLVNAFASRFVIANSLYSQELTDKQKQEAMDAVLNRERTFAANQTVVQRGQIITEQIFEALSKMGLVESRDNTKRFLSTLCITFALAAFFIFYMFSNEWTTGLNISDWLLICILFILFLFLSRLLTTYRTILPYLFPLAAFGMTIYSLYGIKLGIVFSIIMSFLVPFDFSSSGVFACYYLITTLTAMFVLGKGKQLIQFIKAGFYSGLIGIPVIYTFQFVSSSSTPDSTGLLTLGAASIGAGLISGGFTLFAQYFLSSLVGITTQMQLMELIRPDSPLLQHILQTAPGTYQHSLMVANLAEQAAKDIDADPLLARAGAMYHDAGKTMNPTFFVENQYSAALNLHNDISPELSASTIIHHVTDGAELMKKYHIPNAITNFVLQHHGTGVTRFQLSKAIETEGEENVDKTKFSYPGPKPQSKETALVMLADTCEARARADKPTDDKQIDELIRSVFSYFTETGQLDDSPITLSDLTKTREAFARVLRNTYHSRMKYPMEDKGKKKQFPSFYEAEGGIEYGTLSLKGKKETENDPTRKSNG